MRLLTLITTLALTSCAAVDRTPVPPETVFIKVECELPTLTEYATVSDDELLMPLDHLPTPQKEQYKHTLSNLIFYESQLVDDVILHREKLRVICEEP